MGRRRWSARPLCQALPKMVVRPTHFRPDSPTKPSTRRLAGVFLGPIVRGSGSDNGTGLDGTFRRVPEYRGVATRPRRGRARPGSRNACVHTDFGRQMQAIRFPGSLSIRKELLVRMIHGPGPYCLRPKTTPFPSVDGRPGVPFSPSCWRFRTAPLGVFGKLETKAVCLGGTQ